MSGWTKYTVSAAGAIVDPASVAKNSGRQIDWDSVPESYRATAITVKAAAAALAAATSITVDALPGTLPKGAVLVFGTGEFAKLTAKALAGATSIAVEALVNGIEDDDEAIYAGSGAKTIKGFTAMVELTSGKIVPRAVRPAAETTSSLLATPAVEGDRSAALTGYGCYVGGVFYENLLPDASGDPAVLPSDYKTELAANGCRFVFEQHNDDMA